MSYILDALNKSERERTGAKTPGLDTVHQRAEQVDSDSPQRWPLILAMILTLNFAVLAIWYFMPTSREETSISNSPSYDSSFPSITQDTVTGSQAFEQPQRNASRQPPNTAEEKSIRESSPSDIQEELRTYPLGTKPIGQPLNTSQRLAAMRFSSHIFASDKDLRMVVVDGRRMIEGDTFGDGIHLHQITEDGVVFEYRGERYPIDILSQWDN
jgi:hypothetical protein